MSQDKKNERYDVKMQYACSLRYLELMARLSVSEEKNGRHQPTAEGKL